MNKYGKQVDILSKKLKARRWKTMKELTREEAVNVCLEGGLVRHVNHTGHISFHRNDGFTFYDLNTRRTSQANGAFYRPKGYIEVEFLGNTKLTVPKAV